MRRLFFLAVVTVCGTATGAIACPDYAMPAVAAFEASGGQLRAPRAFDVVAGGETSIWDCANIRPETDQGAGYFSKQPDFSFDLRDMEGLRLIVSAESSCDSTMLINTAAANWYYDDDDNGNLAPRIVLTRPEDGRIDVWLGSYSGDYCDAQLRMEAIAQ